MQFRVTHLLLAMLLVAFAAFWLTSERRENTTELLIVSGGFGVAGLAWGWMLGRRPVNHDSIAFPLIVFSALNALAWLIHRSAMSGVHENTFDLDFPYILRVMVGLDNAYAFGAVAVAIAAGLLLAGIQKNPALLNAIGAFALGFWFMVFALGYFCASSTLWQDLGLP
ncbi:hypothetical protein Pla175_03540 [Pirellulimonas nuda]|uniref:Uncharacterized protein n=1 Tax=Pirellulimonas nuda TaxID=2528009 RepID=A0A518D698_9BACT|nr:hypothetical protein [Pirellulimonas nuda]QDU87000.1 hypothetical protein Pla175_03540 [Pirellulimonas nuda]